MCDDAVYDEPSTLQYVPDKLKTRDICEQAIKYYPWNIDMS